MPLLFRTLDQWVRRKVDGSISAVPKPVKLKSRLIWLVKFGVLTSGGGVEESRCSPLNDSYLIQARHRGLRQTGGALRAKMA
ncbi:hypothetical protein NPIL_447341 [Nephila pilipes]|uniref:Uncharacterized protein n=1 Tax=Nephila pilipes TaxID=299642 RepID=A0A8X6P2W2_NEPPI|nr:hypothetical protein NPIL_447341 [Nephila pilipes]